MDLLVHTQDTIVPLSGTTPTIAAEGELVDEPRRALDKGDTLGRYLIVRKLGAGAMGTVYLGYDPELDRKLALKLLHGSTSEAKRRALLREAQAMAKLRHPNVVAVHDVGEHHGQVYVAMEFVEGLTLREWLRAEPRTWRAVLDLFVCAARGLEAAHACELVHRDFKPDNVMVSHKGEVMVMDFGLARAIAPSVTHDDELESLSGSLATPVADLESVGKLAGTPAYMAPEQFGADELGPAVDQFAYCVSVWEALCGERPFAGSTIAALYTNAAEGRVRPPPAGARMPRWLERVLRRGLASQAEARWSSMTALLVALERGRRRGRRRAVIAGVAALVVMVGGVVGWQQRARQALISACEAEGDEILAIWHDDAREQLRASLLATGLRFAPASAEALIPWLDAYRDAWRSGRTEVCRHATIARDWDAESIERATWCFEDRRLQLEATIDQLTGIDRASARRAVRLASYLEPVEPCLDLDVLGRLPVPPQQDRGEIREIRGMLNESDRMRYSGRNDEALALAVAARSRADALGWPPLLANARFTEGRGQLERGRYAESEPVLVQAYFEALNAGSSEVAFRAARSLISVSTALERFREAELWARHADQLATELSDPSGLDTAEGHYLSISVHLGLGDHARAIDEGQAALAMRTAVLGADHPITASAMTQLGNVYVDDERPSEALELFERAALIWEDATGPNHPIVGELDIRRARALFMLGRTDEALARVEQGLAVLAGASREGHPNYILGLEQLAEIHASLGQLDAAELAQRRALTIAQERLGPRHSTTAMSLLGMAEIDRARGRSELALERCRGAVEQLEVVFEPGHPRLVLALDRLARIHMELGQPELAAQRWRELIAGLDARGLGSDTHASMRGLVGLGDALRVGASLDEAQQSYARALALGEAELGEDELALVPSLVGLAELALARNDAVAALDLAERAATIVEQQRAAPDLAAQVGGVLARARANE